MIASKRRMTWPTSSRFAPCAAIRPQHQHSSCSRKEKDIGAQIAQLARPFFKATDELIVEALGLMGFKEQ